MTLFFSNLAKTAENGYSQKTMGDFLKNIDAIIFDMDGVLLDSETISIQSWRVVAAESALDTQEGIDALHARCMGQNRTDIAAVLSEHYRNVSGFDATAFLNRSSAIFHEIAKNGVPLMPGVKDCLEFLSSLGITLALASSTREATVRRELEDARILGFFKTLTTGDMVSHSKPEPDIYLLAAASLGANPARCIAVEDSPNGAESALRAGMRLVLVPDKIAPSDEMKRRAWKVLGSLSELKCAILDA